MVLAILVVNQSTMGTPPPSTVNTLAPIFSPLCDNAEFRK
jgi:hypothetical protein